LVSEPRFESSGAGTDLTDHLKGGWIKRETRVEILYYILIGVVVGALARLLLPGRDPIGIIGTIVVGILGAVIGGYLAGAVFGETEGVDWIASILVAIGLLFLYRRMTYGRSRGRVL
jgi:uncharacterized membrane protein YeaQ/YmgE (transglycosylase-associated protein family)